MLNLIIHKRRGENICYEIYRLNFYPKDAPHSSFSRLWRDGGAESAQTGSNFEKSLF